MSQASASTRVRSRSPAVDDARQQVAQEMEAETKSLEAAAAAADKLRQQFREERMASIMQQIRTTVTQAGKAAATQQPDAFVRARVNARLNALRAGSIESICTQFHEESQRIVTIDNTLADGLRRMQAFAEQSESIAAKAGKNPSWADLQMLSSILNTLSDISRGVVALAEEFAGVQLLLNHIQQAMDKNIITTKGRPSVKDAESSSEYDSEADDDDNDDEDTE